MLKAYISSTFKDLKDCRSAAIDILKSMRIDVRAMENYVAENARPVDACLRDVADCDIYILLVAWRYGYIPNEGNPENKSITELEYDHAVRENKMQLIFLLKEDALWPSNFVDRGENAERVAAFRTKLSQDRVISSFSDSKELASQISAAVHNLEVPFSRPGNFVFQNLPQPDYGHFVGRTSELAKLHALLSPDSSDFLISIDGVDGIGKSALATEVARHYLYPELLESQRRFDALIWISAKPSALTATGIVKRKLTIRTLRDIFTTISITLEREDITRANFEDQLAIVRNALTKQRTLLIVDNLEAIDDEEVIEFLREIPAPTKAIVTTRHRIDVAYPQRLLGLPWEDSKVLINQECHKKGVPELTEADARQLYERTGGVPLAIVWSVSQLGLGYSVRSVLRRLAQPNNDIARYCLEGVLDRVRGTDTYKLLLALALFASGVDGEAVISVAGIEPELSGEEGLVQLEVLSLVNRTPTGYDMLPLTRQFALSEVEQFPDCTKFRQRWKDWLITFAQRVHPSHWYDFNPIEVSAGIANLQAALEWSIDNEDSDLFLRLVSVVCWHFNYSGLWTELIDTAELGIRIAKESKDLRVEAELRSALLGFAYSQQHEFQKALEHCNEALRIYREELRDVSGEALALSHLAQVHRKQGDFPEAERLYQEARNLVQNRPELHRTYIAIQFELGKLARDNAQWSTAYKLFEVVREWLEAHPDDILNKSQLQGAVHGHLALVEYYQGDYLRAKNSCIESINFFTDYNLRVAFGSLYWRLAMIEEALENYDNAFNAITTAIEWFDRLGMITDKKQAQALLMKIEAKRVAGLSDVTS